MYICNMVNIYLQYWKISDKTQGVIPYGCSLHKTLEDVNEYIDNVYRDREGKDIPDSYIRIVGKPIFAKVTKDIYITMLSRKTVFLKEVEMNNLINCEDLIVV